MDTETGIGWGCSRKSYACVCTMQTCSGCCKQSSATTLLEGVAFPCCYISCGMADQMGATARFGGVPTVVYARQCYMRAVPHLSSTLQACSPFFVLANQRTLLVPCNALLCITSPAYVHVLFCVCRSKAAALARPTGVVLRHAS